MSIPHHSTPDGIYHFKAGTKTEQIYRGVNARLRKVEALAVVAANINIEAFSVETMSAYLGALSDIAWETKALYEEIIINSD